MKKFLQVIRKYDIAILYSLTFAISLASFLIVFFNNQQNLSDYDAIARLNIARKIVDSLTPGLGQLGGIWLPFPQVLMVPFVWNDFLWRSGIAGSVPSMISFIVSAIYLYKTVVLITKSKAAAFIGWLCYALNFNVLFLQATPMSEAFFQFNLIMIIYFLTKWVVTKNINNIYLSAIFVSILTLTRYESYVIYIASVLTIIIILLFTKTTQVKVKHIEGIIIMFATLASFGILLWSLYSALIYKDPIYWFNLYSGKKQVVENVVNQNSNKEETPRYLKESRPILTSIKAYGWSMTLINGVIPISLSFISIVLIIITLIKINNVNRSKYVPLIVISTFLMLFLILGYSKRFIPIIETPPFAISTLFDNKFNNASSSNIRYGVIVAPLIALSIGLASSSRIFTTISFILLCLQIYINVFSPYMFMFQLGKKYKYSQLNYAKWFRENYDGGLVMISASRHEPFMLQSNLDYKKFIYEGSQRYWRESLIDPSRYANWVIYNDNLQGDAINEFLFGTKVLENEFNLVYENNGVKIYKIKNEPDLIIK